MSAIAGLCVFKITTQLPLTMGIFRFHHVDPQRYARNTNTRKIEVTTIKFTEMNFLRKMALVSVRFYKIMF